MTAAPSCWVPDWPLPPNLQARQTTRHGGVSQGPWHSLNLALHTGDAPAAVQENRQRLQQSLGLARAPRWPQQVHGTTVIAAAHVSEDTPADAVLATAPGELCAIQTADCLPVLLASVDGHCCAAAHAGWRGLADGILEATLAQMAVPPSRLTAWLGPAIGPAAFVVGPEVRARFLQDDPGAGVAFRPGPDGDRWRADLYTLARRRLQRAGLPASALYGGGRCTFTEAEHFFSYRRDGTCGRMATLIWRVY
jgi:YfiH family protein